MGAHPRLAAVSGLAVIAGLTILSYAPVLRAGFVYEDTNASTAIAHPDNPWSWHQTPILAWTYRLNARWGGFHGTSVAVHLGNTLLLFAFLRRVLPRGAWLGAAIFALHPLATEAVAYLSGRGQALTGTGVLMALFAVVAASPLAAWVLALSGSLLAAGSSPPTAVALIALLPLAAWMTRADRARTWAITGCLAIGVVFAALTYSFRGPDFVLMDSPGRTIATNLAHVARLFTLWLLPWAQSIELPTLAADQIAVLIVLLGAWTLFAWSRRRDTPWLWLAFAWGLAVVAPRVLLPHYEGLHERHLYVGAIGWAWASAQALTKG